MNVEKQQILERMVEFIEAASLKPFHAKYDDRAIITVVYGVQLDLTDPEERAFYDSFQEMRRNGA